MFLKTTTSQSDQEFLSEKSVGPCWVIHWSQNLAFYWLHFVAKWNSQHWPRTSLEQGRQAGVVVVVWDGERHMRGKGEGCVSDVLFEDWGDCVGRLWEDRALFLILQLSFLLGITSFRSFPSSPEAGHPETFPSLTLPPHFSVPSWL